MTHHSVELVQRIEEVAKKKVELCGTAEDIATLVEAGQAAKAEMNDVNADGKAKSWRRKRENRGDRRRSRDWYVNEDEKVQK